MTTSLLTHLLLVLVLALALVLALVDLVLDLVPCPIAVFDCEKHPIIVRQRSN